MCVFVSAIGLLTTFVSQDHLAYIARFLLVEAKALAAGRHEDFGFTCSLLKLFPACKSSQLLPSSTEGQVQPRAAFSVS